MDAQDKAARFMQEIGESVIKEKLDLSELRQHRTDNCGQESIPRRAPCYTKPTEIGTSSGTCSIAKRPAAASEGSDGGTDEAPKLVGAREGRSASKLPEGLSLGDVERSRMLQRRRL